MLSAVEREYIGDPGGFERRYKDSYIRKIRNGIRKKVGISVEELAKIILFSQSNFDKNNSPNGKNRKSIVPNGSVDVLRDALNWLESGTKERVKIEKSMESNIQITIKSIFEDTKIGKDLY